MNSINVFGLLILCLLSLLNFCSSSEDNFKEIEINDGIIRGVKNTTIIDKKDYYAFRGIPFAKTPTGNRRFLAPQRPEPWKKNVLDTFKYRSYCPQTPSFDNEKQALVGEEDCLYLNVYTPDLTPKTKLAVMVNIHGGAFAEGNGDDVLYGPDFLIDENVIYVAINYRLGILGFLSMGTDEYSGNMGMKDQNMALQWVYDNIHHFGGDNNQITIFGESAGAASVHLHTLSPLSKNLFNRAIIQSGSALNVWAIQNNTHQKVLMDYAKKHGKNIDNVDKLMEYLTDVDFTELVSSFALKFEKDVTVLFGPIIEAKSVQSPFLTERPETIIDRQEQKKCDRMFGYTSNEYMLFTVKQIKTPSLIKEFLDDFKVVVPKKEFIFDYNSIEYKMLASEIKTHYFGENTDTINNDTIYKFIDLYSDLFFTYSVDTAAKLHAKDQEHKTYYYRFSVDADLNFAKKLLGKIDLPGSTHMDELCYLYSCKFYLNSYKNLKSDSVELQAIKRINKLWTNFAKFGNPTPDANPADWKPITSTKINFAEINNDGVLPGENPNSEHFNFWNNLFIKYSHLVTDEKKTN